MAEGHAGLSQMAFLLRDFLLNTNKTVLFEYTLTGLTFQLFPPFSSLERLHGFRSTHPWFHQDPRVELWQVKLGGESDALF